MTVGMTIRRAWSVMLAVCVLVAGGGAGHAQVPPAVLQARQAAAAKTVMLPDGPLPEGTVGLAYGTSVTAVGGSGLYSILISGAVPPGTALVRGGGVIALEGVPTQEGTYTFHVAVTDIDLGSSASHDYSVYVASSQRLLQPHITPPTIPVSVTESFHASDAPSVLFPVKINVTESFKFQDGDGVTLPANLNQLETFKFSDKVSIFVAAMIASPEALKLIDVVKLSATDPLGISPATANAGTYNAAYSQTFMATGGVGPATLTATSTLPAGLGFNCSAATCVLSGTPTQTGSFQFQLKAQDTVTSTSRQYPLVIAAASQTITVGPLPTPVYGGAAFSVSASASSGLPVTITRTSGPATGSGNGPYTASGAGTVNFTATQTGSVNYTAAAPVSFSVSVSRQGSVTTVSANPASVTPVQSTTLTATVGPASVGSPTGSVTFYDGNVALGGPVPLVGGQAQLTTTLLSGSHAISATYSGDVNFAGSSSSTPAMVTVAPLDYTLTALSPLSLSVVPGSSGVVSFQVAPLYGTYPGPVSFSVSGLPANATYSVSPVSIAANGGPQTVTVSIQTAAAVVKNDVPGLLPLMPVALAVLVPWLLPGRVRRLRWMGAMLLGLAMAGGGVVLGCGASRSGDRFFGQAPRTYPVVITATSGDVQHTLQVALQIQ